MRLGTLAGVGSALLSLLTCVKGTVGIGGVPPVGGGGTGAQGATGATGGGASGAVGGAGSGGGATGGGGAVGGAGGGRRCPDVVDSAELVAVETPSGGFTCVDDTEVTKGQYQSWLSSSPAPSGLPTWCSWNADYTPQDASWPPPAVDLDKPVVGVDWCDAVGFCLDHGKHLCGAQGGGSAPPVTFDDAYISEWFNACSEQGQRAFPYGNAYDGSACNGDGAIGATSDVGSLVGCQGNQPVFDLSGNVWEWENSCSDDIGSSDDCRVRGGSFSAAESDLGCAADALASRDTQRDDLGFRCCAPPLY